MLAAVAENRELSAIFGSPVVRPEKKEAIVALCLSASPAIDAFLFGPVRPEGPRWLLAQMAEAFVALGA